MIGKALAEVSNTTIIRVEFENYIGEKLVPNSLTTRGVQTEQGTSASHTTGTTEAGNFLASWSLNDNVFAVTIINYQSQSVIKSVRSFSFTELATDDFTYTKFKFIQE